MSGNSKVVHLNQARGGETAARAARLPRPLIRLRDEMAEKLKSLLQETLENTDDALFELADRADSNVGQSIFFDAMREMRLRRRRIEADFFQGYQEAFDALDQEDSQPRAEVNLESLALVQHDEMEERVAVENMVSKVRNRLTTDLEHLTLRIDSLLSQRQVRDEQNPLGPQKLCGAFVSACSSLQMDIQARLVVLKLFDKFVISRLQDVYEKANRLLIEQGVMPDMKIVRRQRPASSAASVPPTTVDGQTGEVVSEAGSPEVFGFLRELMAEQRAQGNIPTLMPIYPGAGNQLAGGGSASAPALGHNDLMSMLSVAQQQVAVPGAVLPGVTGNGLINMGAMLQTMMQTEGRAARVNPVDEDVINLVSMLFEFILDDRQLPDTMKALLARLQIPMLKIAILDKSFFGKGGHPARRLLNELATAAIGWNERPEGEADPLRDKVESVVYRLVNDFDDNIGIFEEILADFQKFVKTEQRRGQLIEQRIRDAEEGRAKAELARQDVRKAIAEVLEGRTLPEVAVDLLEGGWSNLLVLHHLKHGTDSDEWKQGMQIARNLVWSLCPPEEPGARREVLQLIPGLVRGIREGLATTSFSPFELDTLLKDLERCHIAVLNRLSARASSPAPVQPAPEAPKAKATSTQADASRSGKAPVQSAVAQAPSEPAMPQEKVIQSSREAVVKAGAAQPPLTASEETHTRTSAVEAGASAGAVHRAPANGVDHASANRADHAPVNPVDSASASLTDNAPASTEEVSEELLAQVGRLQAGCWVEFHESADKKFRAKLAAVIQVTGKYIFVNRTGVKVAEETRAGLAEKLGRGQISLLDDGLLFDRALEAVIGNLRASKQA